jgi:hypothetical protein
VDACPVSRIAWAAVCLGGTTMATVIAYAVTSMNLFMQVAVIACILSIVVAIAAAERVIVAFKSRRGLSQAFHAACFDGSVRIILPGFDERQLRAAITRNGGEKIEWSKLGLD